MCTSHSPISPQHVLIFSFSFDIWLRGLVIYTNIPLQAWLNTARAQPIFFLTSSGYAFSKASSYGVQFAVK